MLLLDITLSTPVALAIVGFFITLGMAFLGLIRQIAKGYYDGIIKKLDILMADQRTMEQDFKPLTIQVALHTEQIKEVKAELGDQKLWLGLHDKDIQGINRVLKNI